MKKMKRSRKEEIVKWLTEEFKNSKILILVNYSGLSVSEMQNLREAIKEKNGNIKVVKNSLIERACRNLSQDEAVNFLQGPICIIWTKEGDEVEIVKGVCKYEKESEKIRIRGGVFKNQVVGVDYIQKISKLPTLKELQTKIVYDIRFPVIRVVNSIKAPVVKIINILNQIKEKKERENG